MTADRNGPIEIARDEPDVRRDHVVFTDHAEPGTSPAARWQQAKTFLRKVILQVAMARR